MTNDIESFASKISQTIKLGENDITPNYTPALKDLRDLSTVCLHLLSIKKEERNSLPEAYQKELNKIAGKTEHSLNVSNTIDTTFSDLFNFIELDLREHGYWSFYHYAGLCTLLSFHYNDMIKSGRLKKINLGDKKKWENPTFEMAVASIYFVTFKLFELPFRKLQSLFEKNEVVFEVRAEYIKQEINKLH